MREIEIRFNKALSVELELLDIQERSLMFWNEPREEMIFKKENRWQRRRLNRLELDEVLTVLSRATKVAG